MTLAQFLRDYGAPFAWILAALGWIISGRQADRREKRKEFRAELDAMENLVKDILSRALSYFRDGECEPSAKTDEMDIRALLHELDLKWQRIKKRQTGGTLGLYVDACGEKLEVFYDLVTSAYVQADDRISVDAVNVHTRDIYVQAHLFVEALHSLFLKKFDRI